MTTPSRSPAPEFQLFEKRTPQGPELVAMRYHPRRRCWARYSTLTGDPDVARWRAIDWLREGQRIRHGPACRLRPAPDLIPADANRTPVLHPAQTRREAIVEEIRAKRGPGRPTLRHYAYRLDPDTMEWELRDTDASVRRIAEFRAEAWVREGEEILRRASKQPTPQPQTLLTLEGIAGRLRLAPRFVRRLAELGRLPDPWDDGLEAEGRVRVPRWSARQIELWLNWNSPIGFEFRTRWRRLERHERRQTP